MNENKQFPIPPEVRERFKRFAEQATGAPVKDTHIKKINVHAFSSRIKRPVFSQINVGDELDLNLSNLPHEQVCAIFEANNYLVVTPDKGKANATVYFFDPSEVSEVEREEI